MDSPKHERSSVPEAALPLNSAREQVEKPSFSWSALPAEPMMNLAESHVGRLTDLGAIFHETAKKMLSWRCHGVVMV